VVDEHSTVDTPGSGHGCLVSSDTLWPVSTSGVIVGRVIDVQPHPNGERIRLALVDVGDDEKVQIVFGGIDNVLPGAYVPVAPPGARVPVQRRKMRRERFRGSSSHGMLCSLLDLGWALSAPDEVAQLHRVKIGDPLDDITADRQRRIVLRSTGRVRWATHLRNTSITRREVILTPRTGIPAIGIHS
jgi:phenylalanyl-tRNA synthetase beta chain